MKLYNTTSLPNYFLRRMTAWAAKQLELPARRIKVVTFRRRSDGFVSGRAYLTTGRVVVSVGSAIISPERSTRLVHVVAHELAHLLLHHEGSRSRRSKRYGTVSSGGSEQQTEWYAKAVVREFESTRDALLSHWQTAPPVAVATPAVSLTEKRATKARNDLVRWERKLRLAKTKVRKLTLRVRYYDRKLQEQS